MSEINATINSDDANYLYAETTAKPLQRKRCKDNEKKEALQIQAV
jgi:hypothetical protein